MSEIEKRMQLALRVSAAAAKIADDHFKKIETLTIEHKASKIWSRMPTEK